MSGATSSFDTQSIEIQELKECAGLSPEFRTSVKSTHYSYDRQLGLKFEYLRANKNRRTVSPSPGFIR